VLTNEIIYILVYSLIFVIFINLYDTESTPRPKARITSARDLDWILTNQRKVH